MVKAKRNVQVQVTTTNTPRTRRGATQVALGNTRRRRQRRRRGAVTVSLTTPVRTRRRRVLRTRRNVTTTVRRTLQKTGVLGPKPAISQSATATLGTVMANQGQDVELEGAFILNPALTKETTGSNQFGPVQVAAATYNLWKLKRAQVRLTPLVGASAVSGTAVRVSLNLSAAPSSCSWSALGARKHVDTSPGRFVQFNINERDIPGPKEGWFQTSTKGTPEMAIGGSIEIHTLGKTESTYKNEQYNGPLFLVEMHATWQFTNYSPNPGMLNLVRGTAKETAGSVEINATAGQPITLTTPENSQVTRASGGRIVSRNRAAGTPSVGEVVWQIVDTSVDAIASAFPPPFNWLFKGGWWFMKRVTGLDAARDAAGKATFYVYQSIADAKNNIPCIASTTTSNSTLSAATWEYSQITPGNSGFQEDLAARYLDGDAVDGGGGDNPSLPSIDVNLPISYCGTLYDPTFTRNDFGFTALRWRIAKKTGDILTRCTQPDNGPCLRFSYGTNSYPFVPNGVFELGTFLNDPYNTQFNTFIQSRLGYLIDEADPAQYVTNGLPVYAGTSSTVQLGTAVLASTLERNDGAIYATTVIFRANKTEQVDYEILVGSDTSRITSYVNRGHPPEGLDQEAGGTQQPLYLTSEASINGDFKKTLTFTEGNYYGMCYLGSVTDTFVQLADQIMIPLSTSVIPNEARGDRGVAVVLAFANKRNNDGPLGAMLFSPLGSMTGLNMPFKFIQNPNYTWSGVSPTALVDESDKFEEIDRALGKLQEQIKKMTLDNTDSLTDQIKFEELKDQVDALIRPPTPQIGACGGESENDLDSHTDTEDSGSDTETEQDNLYPPLECECKWGGHKHCPYPKRDELWSDPPEDICEVDGTQHGLVNVLIKGGLSPRKAKRAIALQNEDSPARVFQNLYEAHIECGLAKNTARGLSYCHALRALAGHDPYEVDSEGEQPALKKPKY